MSWDLASVVLGGIFLAVLHFIGLWDFLCFFGVIASHTVSWYVQSWCLRAPVLTFSAGFLCGHLFFGLRS